MAEKIDVGMPNDLTIKGGYEVVFAAVDPTTGADVSGVNVSDAVVTASDDGGAVPDPGDPILLGVSG